jgi:hypothetical protein
MGMNWKKNGSIVSPKLLLIGLVFISNTAAANTPEEYSSQASYSSSTQSYSSTGYSSQDYSSQSAPPYNNDQETMEALQRLSCEMTPPEGCSGDIDTPGGETCYRYKGSSYREITNESNNRSAWSPSDRRFGSRWMSASKKVQICDSNAQWVEVKRSAIMGGGKKYEYARLLTLSPKAYIQDTEGEKIFSKIVEAKTEVGTTTKTYFMESEQVRINTKQWKIIDNVEYVVEQKVDYLMKSIDMSGSEDGNVVYHDIFPLQWVQGEKFNYTYDDQGNLVKTIHESRTYVPFECVIIHKSESTPGQMPSITETIKLL